jgi:bifunctional enzyme CysN/CysC/sulfate adenylyltransferase subunit 1
VQTIVSYDGDLDEAIPSQSVVLKLEREIDLSRGDMLVSAVNPPQVSKRFAAMVVWLNAEPMRLNQAYLVKHAGRQVKAKATRIRFRVDVNNLTEHPASELEMNGIADVEFEASVPLFFDPYTVNRTTGSFILIDAISNATVGAAMIREDLSQSESSKPRAAHLSEGAAGSGKVTVEERHQRHGHRSAIFAVVGNRALAERLERSLFERGFHAVLVNDEDLSSTSLLSVLSALREAGAAVIHSSATTSTEQRAALAEVAGEFLFDIQAADQNHSVEEALKRVLPVAEKLRIDVAATGKGKADGDAFTD